MVMQIMISRANISEDDIDPTCIYEDDGKSTDGNVHPGAGELHLHL